MRIDVRVVETSSGHVTPNGDQLDYLDDDQRKDVDYIGYHGGNLEGYLNQLDLGHFKVRTLVVGRSDFSEKFIVVRVWKDKFTCDVDDVEASLLSFSH